MENYQFCSYIFKSKYCILTTKNNIDFGLEIVVKLFFWHFYFMYN